MPDVGVQDIDSTYLKIHSYPGQGTLGTYPHRIVSFTVAGDVESLGGKESANPYDSLTARLDFVTWAKASVASLGAPIWSVSVILLLVRVFTGL